MGAIVPFSSTPLCEAQPRPAVDGAISAFMLGLYVVVEIIEEGTRLQAWLTAEQVSILCNASHRKTYAWLDDYHSLDEDGSYAQLTYHPLFKNNASVAIAFTKRDGSKQLVGIILSEEGQQAWIQGLAGAVQLLHNTG
ncbi:MAG TPA: hypothetical protein VFT59_01960 [Candidatus Saccharimonadales bacterium]|nr:hypothetical protein [Candidatus Saccharimonadales bacterium]